MKHRPMALALSAAIFCSCEEEGPQIDIESAISVRDGYRYGNGDP